jgi:Uma2 family endonuclease
MSTVPQRRFTPEEYLALERQAEYKSEYLDGQIYAMTGASRQHNRIVLNAGAALHGRLRGGPCEAFVNDMRVKVSPTGLYTYPDIAVVCGEARFEDRELDTLLNPAVVFEVLSDSTEKYDRGEKFVHYRRQESLAEYVLVAQSRIRVEHFQREGDRWMLSEVNGPDSTLRLNTVGCEISLRDLYERVEFPEELPVR